MQTIVPSVVPSVVPLPTLINDREYYNSKDLQAFKPEFYYGYTSKPRNIITKREIPESEYIYATFEKLTKKWNLSDDKCKKAQLLISKQWVQVISTRCEKKTSCTATKTKTTRRVATNYNSSTTQMRLRSIGCL
jgi:hypothetical protein